MLALIAGVTLARCSAGERPRDDGGPDGGADGGLDGGADVDLDASGDADGERPPAATCGDGVVDEGEECDDRNRLDGDGCDWLCREGDGEPPPAADPDAAEYDADGAPRDVEGSPGSVCQVCGLLPVEWGGEAFTTAFYVEGGGAIGDLERSIHIEQFDSTGVMLGHTESQDTRNIGPANVALDLVWNGEGYGLFYVEPSMVEWEVVVTPGVWFVALDASGKPVGEPVLVVATTIRTAPAATWAGGHYALALQTPPACAELAPADDCDNGRHEIRLWLVDERGGTESLPGPVTVTDRWAGWNASVAAAPDGYGVLVVEGGEEEHPSDSVRFVWVSRDLAEVRTSGTLGNSAGGDVVFTGDRFAGAWLDVNTETHDSARLCVARFSVSGRLESAPICHERLTSEVLDRAYPVSLAYGNGGFGLAVMVAVEGAGVYGSEATLWFQRSDGEGVALGRPHLISRGPWSEGHVRRYGVGFGAGDFAVLYEHQDFHDGLVFRLQRFAPR